MKTAIIASLIASAAAFAPAKDASRSTALKMAFTEDFGATAPLGFFDPLGLVAGSSKQQREEVQTVRNTTQQQQQQLVPMAANANSDLSTISSPAGAVPDDLPVVEVEGVDATVKVKWGTQGSQQTTAGLDASYTDTFHATDSTGVEPLVKTYGTLLGCNGGTLTIQATRYCIQVIQKQQQANDYNIGITEPPRKRARADQIIVNNIDEHCFVPPDKVSIPILSEKNPPTFTAKPNWLENICDMIIRELDKEDTELERVPPLCLARCSRGGKTRALYEIAKKLKTIRPDIAVLYVTFNDFSAIQDWEQQDPVGALFRRIAFAALEGRNYQDSDAQYEDRFRRARVSSAWVEEWLGDAPCVLLIDELNLVKDFGPNGSHFQSLSAMLKDVFLSEKGRYFVFTSHVVTIDDKLSQFIDAKSDRRIKKAELPLIPSLAAAVASLSSDLTVREAIFYGLVPALIYTAKHGVSPTEKRQNVLNKWIENQKVSDRIVLFILRSLLTGAIGSVPAPMMELMDVTDTGLVRWIPFHLVYVLEELTKSLNQNVRIEDDNMRKHIKAILDLFAAFRGSKQASGEGWEALFVLILLVRALTGEAFEGLGLNRIEEKTSVKYNEPYNNSSGQSLHEVKKLQPFLKSVPKEVEHGPQLSVYYPHQSSFEIYDCFLVAWDKNGLQKYIHGYQLKEGAGSQEKNAANGIARSYLIRGAASQETKEADGWLIPSRKVMDEFFGVSGKHWTPEKWKSLST